MSTQFRQVEPQDTLFDATTLHKDAVIIDAVAPLLQHRRYVDLYKEGGVTCVAPTLSTTENAAVTFSEIARWLGFISRREDLLLVRDPEDVLTAKAQGKLGILFHCQGTSAFEQELDYVLAFRDLGLRMVMLTYNTRNYAGDGCEEAIDGGLSRFGRRLIERLNRHGLTVDLTHTGFRTTMEAMDVSSAPVVFSHSNATELLDIPRNIRPEQAKGAANTRGLVAVTLAPYFIRVGGRPTVDDFIDHLAYFADLIGIDHVGLGLDYYWGQQPFATDAEALLTWEEFVAAGVWDPATYPKPPHLYPEGMDTPAGMPALTTALQCRGFSAEDIRKVLGGNWLRVFRDTWRS